MIRPKYACRGCEGAVVRAKALPRLIENSMASTALVTHVVVSKFAWFSALYRQVQILAGHGVHLDRSTLAGWVKRTRARGCGPVIAKRKNFEAASPRPKRPCLRRQPGQSRLVRNSDWSRPFGPPDADLTIPTVGKRARSRRVIFPDSAKSTHLPLNEAGGFRSQRNEPAFLCASNCDGFGAHGLLRSGGLAPLR
jgi:hypothetical protein